MGELAERLSLLSVEARSPDGGLTATARGHGDVRVSFAHDAYRGYRPPALARQLEALATLLWARYRRRYREIVQDWARRDPGDEPEPDDADREFQRRLERMHVAGRSALGRVTVRSRALVSWQVEIEPGAALTEREFLAELDSAVAALLADHRARLTLLTDAVYDIGLPRAMRTAG
nr:hypothetical protein [uncultured Actinoplanes sp.]